MNGATVQSQLQRIFQSIQVEDLLISRLSLALNNPEILNFSIALRDLGNRRPDGWFHPSTHPLWPELKLYWYMTEPERIVSESRNITDTLTVTQGSFWHAFVQYVLLDNGLLKEVNPSKEHAHDKVEWFVKDDALKSRGALDGVLVSENLGLDQLTTFEFKTLNATKMRSAPSNGAFSRERREWFKEKFPPYYLQAQEYMRLSGSRSHQVLMMAIEYPFDMVEINLPYDAETAGRTVAKYRFVLECVEKRMPPSEFCCRPNSTAATATCIARTVCPRGVRQSETVPVIAPTIRELT